MVLDDDSKQLGPSLLVLGRFFFLGVSFGLDTKWARLAKSFGPIVSMHMHEIIS